MIFRQITAVTLGFITGIIIIELFLWVILATPLWHILPVVEPIIVRPNTESGTELIKGGVFIWPNENRVKVRINSYGLRDKELKTSVDSTRVVLTGDSMVEALQVDLNDTMDNKAEQSLLDLGFDVEIANLGAAGHGPRGHAVGAAAGINSTAGRRRRRRRGADKTTTTTTTTTGPPRPRTGTFAACP